MQEVLRSILENILLKTMYDLPSQDNIEEVIVDAGAAKDSLNQYWFMLKVTVNQSQISLQRLNILNN